MYFCSVKESICSQEEIEANFQFSGHLRLDADWQRRVCSSFQPRIYFNSSEN